jgi:O-methyltransferase involved in polyketide biosynthesis
MTMEKIHLTKEQEGETYLPTLYGKALDARAEHSILHDTFADAVVQRIDFDFATRFKTIAQGGAVTLPLRARLLDAWVREFLRDHPESTVLNLGCGLDSRVFRIDAPPTVRWYDVDLPDVIALRKRLYTQRRDYELIASSVTDLHWLDAIPGNHPVVVVAEGLVMYLPRQAGAALFRRISSQFPSGQLLFDAYSRLTVRILNLMARLNLFGSPPTAAGSQISLPWGIDDPHELEILVPGLRLVTAVPFLTMPELVERLSRSWAQARIASIIGRWKWYQNSMRHLRYAF